MAGGVFQITEDSTFAVGYLVGDTVQIQQGANVSCVLTIAIAGGSGAAFTITTPGAGYVVDVGPMTLIPCAPQPTSGTGFKIGIFRVTAGVLLNKFY